VSLITHELLTNAAKYGALSSPEGRLLINCQREASGAVLTWRETVDHVLPTAGGGGFGSRLITRLALGLGGGGDIEILPSGLAAVIRFALDDALSPGQPLQA
jgi:two-component sensor histidine kinase